MLGTSITHIDYLKIADGHERQERKVLDKAVPIPLSIFCGENLAAAIKKNLLLNWTGIFCATEKQELHNNASARTTFRASLIKEMLGEIKKILEEIDRRENNHGGKEDGVWEKLAFVNGLVINANPAEALGEKRNIRRALNDVKAARMRNTDDGVSLMLAEITRNLREEYQDYRYKLKLKDGRLVKAKDVNEDLFLLSHKISSDISKTAKFLNNVFTVLALTGAILSLLAIFFPFLGALAAGMLTVGTIGICLCAIVLSLKRLAKMVINSFYFDIPIDVWEFLLNIFNLVISIIFVIVGISAFMPASESSFMAYLPDVIKDLVTYVYASVTAAKNFLEAKVSIEILINIWRTIVWLVQLAWPYILRGLVALKDGLSWLYQKSSNFIHNRYYNNIYPHLPEVPPFVGTIANATSSAWSTVSDTASVVATAVKNRASAASEHVSSLISFD